MTEQRRPGKYPDEIRERAVRMVFEAQRRCGSHKRGRLKRLERENRELAGPMRS